MKNMFDPFAFLRLGMQTGMMMAEAQAVIAMRLMGMAGAWNVTDRENTRMVSEKVSAFSDAAMKMGFAAMGGKRPDQIMTAAVRPLRSKTRGNVRRLSRRGPKLP
jgi:hypothetical protein